MTKSDRRSPVDTTTYIGNALAVVTSVLSSRQERPSVFSNTSELSNCIQALQRHTCTGKSPRRNRQRWEAICLLQQWQSISIFSDSFLGECVNMSISFKAALVTMKKNMGDGCCQRDQQGICQNRSGRIPHRTRQTIVYLQSDESRGDASRKSG